MRKSIPAVHASPRSDEENIRPETPDTELAEMLDSFNNFNLLLCGHTHVPVNREVRGRRIINAGSVGLPFDGDPRASYALIYSQPNGQYHVEFRRVAYDVDAVIKQLITVDNTSIRLMLRQMLQSQGYWVEEAADGLGAMAVFQRSQPNIVLLDVMLPHLDGFEVCRQLRQLPGGSDIPILMVTAREDNEAVELAFAAGATDYLIKPVQYALHHLK